MHVGVSGSREGPTFEQKSCTIDILKDLKDVFATPQTNMWFHGGDCLGYDEDAYKCAWILGYKTHGHPPNVSTMRANLKYDKEDYVANYLSRNEYIVDASQIMLFAPNSTDEVLSSGTWACWRYALKHPKNKAWVIIFPNGKVHTNEAFNKLYRNTWPREAFATLATTRYDGSV